MYIFTNAIKNVFRNKGRNLLIGVIIFSIITSVSVSIIINVTTDSIVKDYKEKFGSKVYIQMNEQKAIKMNQNTQGQMIELPTIKPEEYLKYANSKYLKDTLFKGIYYTYSDVLKALDQDAKNNSGMVTSIVGGSINSKPPNMKIIGVSNTSLLEEFAQGKRKIVEGALFTKDKECVISKEFAELNKLKVGDSIQVKDSNYDKPDIILELTITGIYTDNGLDSSNTMFKSPTTNRLNEILTTYQTLYDFDQLFGQKNSIFSNTVTFYLTSPDVLDAFNKEVHEKGMSDLFYLSTDRNSYNQIVKPVEGLKNISTTFMLIILSIGSIILILVSILTIRERKYEIGVLRAMGMEKYKVAIGFIVEMLTIITICLILGILVGNMISQPVSQLMINYQKESTKQTTQGVSFQSFSLVAGGAMEPEKSSLDTLTVGLSLSAVLQITGISLGLGLLSSTIGIIYIMRFEPIKILSERG